MTDNAKQLYNELSKRGRFFDTEEAFEKELQTEEGAKFYYDVASKEGLWMDTFEGFKSDIFGDKQSEEESEDGFVKRAIDYIQKAQPFAHNIEENRKEAETARQEQAYQEVGLTDEDKKIQKRIATLEAEVSSPVSINADGTFHVQEPVLNQYGMPTTITKHSKDAARSQLETAKAQLPSYLKRGEESPEDIMINAAERALNTEEGKNIWNTLHDAAVKDFHTTPEFAELLNKYSLGEVTEQDINNAFNEKYGEQLNRDFTKEISKEGGIMHDYITVADKKFNQKHTDQTSKELDDRIESAIEKSKETRKNSNREKYKSIYGVYPEDDPFGKERTKQLRYEGVLEYETELSSEQELLSARKFNKETRTLIDAVKNGKSFWGGVGDAASDLDTWDLGIGELTRNIELMGVIKKIEGDKELTHAEELLMESALNYFTASAYYSNELGRGYKAGQTSMASVPFMLQFVLSSGTIAAMEASVKGAVETGRRALVSGMIKYAKKKGNAALAKYGAKKAAGDAGKMVSGVISGAASSVIGAGYMTGVYSLPRVAGGTIERMTGELDKDWDSNKGGYVFTERKNAQGLGEALWNSFADNYVENLSEMVLAKTLDPVKAYLGGTNMFKNIARNDYIGAIVDLRNNPALRSLRQTTQFGGYFEEVAEEYLGGILRRMLNTDVNTWQEAGLDLDGQIDIFLGLAPTSILFGTYGVASHYGGIAIKAKELREYLSTDEQKEMFNRLMSESRSGEFGDVAHNFIRNVLTSTDPRMTVERKKEILMSVANKYHNLLSEELQNVATQVTEQEAKPVVDELTKNVMHEGNNAIYATVDSQGNPLFIVGGKVGFTNDNVVDLSSSDNRLQVRYVKADNTLGDVQEVRAANLTMPVSNENIDNFSKFQMAKFIAQSKSLDNFEFDGHVYSIEGEDLGTIEEFNTLQGNTEQTGEPKIDTKPRTVVNEEYTVTVDGEKKTVKITSMVNSPMIQNEDGSIKEGKFSVTVNGEAVRGDERKQKYIDAISEQLKEKHAKALEAYRAKQAESTVTETPSSVLTDEDRAAATAEQERMAKEAEKQSILASAQQKKAKKYTAEEAVVVLMEQGNDVATRLVGSRINKLRTQIDEINADENKDELEKWEDSKELSDQLAEYEAAVVKWLGQETLDAINATRVAPVAPIEEGPAVPPVQAPAVEPAQVEEHSEPDTTPLPPAEPTPETIGEGGEVDNEEDEEVAGQEREPIDLSSDDIVFVRQDWRVDIARRGENGELRFVDSGKKVGNSWRVMDNKFLVYYNGIPCYALTTVKDVKAFPNNVTLVAQDYTGNKLKVSKWTLKDAEGNKLLKTGAEIQEENIRNNYKSLDDFMNEVVYANPKTGIKLTLGELLATPAVQTNKGQRGKPVYAFQVEQFLNKNASSEDRAAILKDIKHRISEIAGTWNAYVRINNLTDVVTEDNMTDFYQSMKQAGGYKSNGLKIQTQDFEALNSNDITKNPILQMLVMLDQAKELGLFSGDVNMMSVDKLSSIRQGVSKASNMSNEDILQEMEDIRKDRAIKNDNSIASKRYNELKRELKKRTDAADNANVETTEEKPAASANNEEAEMHLNNLATLRQTRNDAISAGDTNAANSIQALIATVEEELKAKGIEYPADVLPTTEQPAAQQTQDVDADSLREEYNRIQSDLNEFVYETDEEIDAANTRLAEIKEQLRSVGEFMIGDIAESSASKESKELALASEIQSLAGSEDIEVMDTTAEQIEESTPLMTSNGVIYGYAAGNKIYLTPDGMNTNTPVHEYTHIWAKAMQKNNPKAWKSIVEQLKKADALWNEVVNDPNYENIKGNDDAIASEVLSRYSGKNGAAKLEAEAERVVTEYKGMEKGLKVKALISRVKKALEKFWSWVGKDLFKIESFESVESIADRVLYDMLNSTQLNLDNSDRNPTNFDKKIKKMQETLDKGGKNVLSLQEISELTDTLEDDLRQGNKPLLFERLPLRVLQEGLKGERTLAEALTIAALKSRRASRAVVRDAQEVTADERETRQRSSVQMDMDLHEYAREKGMLMDNVLTVLKEKYGYPIGEGQESFVYLDEEKGVVVKAKHSQNYETTEELLEGMVLNNFLLEDNKQHIIGFGYDTDGLFRIVYETPYVELGDNVITQEQKDEKLRELGFEPVEGEKDVYSNGVFLAKDLHNENIVVTPDGNIRITDAKFAWEAGEHYRESTPEELERDEENEEKLDNWVDNGIEFMIGPSAPAGAPRDPSDPMHIDSEAARRLQAKSQKYFAELANPKAQLSNELDAMNEWVAKLLDRTEGVRQIMESINKFRKENGLPPMGEGFDVRTMVEAMDSKIANETKLFVMTKENELRKAIYKLAKRVEKSDFYKKYKFEKEPKQNGKKSKLTPREIIERYLIACDSIEREELKGNPRGAGDFLKRMGVDMVQYRQEFLDTFANTQEGIDEINHLWDTIRGVTDMVISEGERSGLISQEEAISYKRRRFYVPERDFAEVEANEELQVKDAGYGSGRMGNKLMATQEAEGGESLAANILANMTLLARDAIVKANKNIVKLAMFDLLRANEEWCKAKHVPIPRQVWYKRNPDGSVTRVTDGPTAPEKKIMRDLKTQIRDRENEIIQERMLAESATDAATRQAHMDIIAEIEDEIESLRQANPFLDEFDARDMMFLSRHTQKESTVTVFVDGVPCEMHFPNMTIVANALNGTTNKKFAAEGLKKLTSALSATMTVYNPAFFTVNVVRDIPFILAKGYAEYGWQFPVRFAAQLTKKLFTLDVWKAVAGNYKDVKNPYIREFFEGGGNTGYSTIPDIDKLKSATRRWDRRRTDIGMQDIGDVISYMNTFSEVWTRLAAYSVVRDMGGTKEAGVRAAKNLSVNFNRKGLGAPIWDTFMNMSFFANAALQGASGFYRTFKGSKDTVAKNVAVGFRAANAFLATPMFAGFILTLLHPDDDDELLWINDWDRDNYWYVGENGFRIAINEQIKPAWVIGVNIALGMKGRRTKEQIASSIISSVFTNWLPTPQNVSGALTMITNSYYGTKDYSTAQIIENLTVPQAMASFTDIANNVDFMGYKIKNESGDLPAYMSNESSALLYKMVAEFLYEAKGGDKDLHSRHIEVVNEDGTIDYKKMSDLYDKSPKEINTILSIAIGSTWKDFGNAIAVASTDGEFVPTDYQTIKRFYKPTDKEMTILSIMREARGITKDYTEQYNNYINQLEGNQLDGNTEKGRKARERIENLIGKGEDRGQKEMLKALVNAYDANTMYSHAKQFGMNETQFKKSLKENRPDLYDAFDAYNNTSREELVRKVLTLTRDIKDMEVKTIEAEELLDEIIE